LGPNVSFVDYPKEETENVRNAYFNAIHECDRQIGRLVATLRELNKLDNTLLVITGENGEAFHECGTVTHARAPVEPALHVACVLHAPDFVRPGIESYPLEHVDLAPTVLGLLGIPPHPNFQGIDVLSEHRPPLDQRLTFAHVRTGFAHADALILAGRWKLTRMPDTGQETLHDLLHDPWQQDDVSRRFPRIKRQLSRTLRQWRQRQLAYYKFPEYYLSYYPPPPPRSDLSVDDRTFNVTVPAARSVR
jgi:arylsulfatase A-like enzyme